MAETVPGTSGDVGAAPRFALGIGLTNECNLSCAFCYRDPSRVDRLDLEQVRAVLDRLPVRSVNLGTGENGMHPRFREVLALLRSRNVKLTMTSNGLSVAAQAAARPEEPRRFIFPLTVGSDNACSVNSRLFPFLGLGGGARRREHAT